MNTTPKQNLNHIDHSYAINSSAIYNISTPFLLCRKNRTPGALQVGRLVPRLIADFSGVAHSELTPLEGAWQDLYVSALIYDDFFDEKSIANASSLRTVSHELLYKSQNSIISILNYPELVFNIIELYWNKMSFAMAHEKDTNIPKNEHILKQANKCSLALAMLRIAYHYLYKRDAPSNLINSVNIFCSVAQFFDDVTDIEEDCKNGTINYLNSSFLPSKVDYTITSRLIKSELILSGRLIFYSKQVSSYIDNLRSLSFFEMPYVNTLLDNWQQSLISVIKHLTRTASSHKSNSHVVLDSDYLSNTYACFVKTSN
ncbi:hypothetical protein [uncultured Pseudodesulfovibrio sp.]|uniref:hypothetical protein n=1 Tax=uncultured Pseudodesulfovibrio sp. TaxID=2035858 RepID=UPI0029C7A164|nr:hypothetical protein [uncultured Pseudodesulfovibrio sp.]